MADGCVLYQAGDTIDYVASGDVDAGDVIVQADLVGIAVADIASGSTGALGVSGVWKMPKAVLSTSALSAGNKVYWDDSGKVVTATADSNKLAGKVTKDAAAAQAYAYVRLSQ